MKTETGRGFLIKGNVGEPTDHPIGKDGKAFHPMMGSGVTSYCPICVNASYIMHPRYRALILRENEKDLADFISRARMLFEPMGANVTEKPARVSWASGAAFIMGHMKDADAFTDYMGQEFQRMLFEELTQISRELLYLQIIGSCRSTFTCHKGCKPGTCRCGALKRQIMNTANPGGKGHLWVKKRFISVGPPNKIYTDPLTKLTRVYIPSTVTDNPYLMRDEGYLAWLEGLPEPIRSAWRYGDWDALGGQYFRDFRPKGPIGNEPPEARHVIDPGEHPLMPFWPRWIGGDWGYNHGFAFFGACKDPNGQTIVYREIVGNETGGEELGVRIARTFFPDMVGLEQQRIDPKLTLFLSPDAFGKRDSTFTIAEGIANGIQTVLGEGAAHFPDLWVTEDTGTPDWNGDRFRRFKIQKKFGIAIRQAQNQRVDGWQHLRGLLRFRQLAQPNPENFNNEYFFELLHTDPNRALMYRDGFELRKPETLPKLLITTDCPHLIEAIPVAIHDEAGKIEDVMKTETLEDDCLDGWRYLLHSQQVMDNREPEQSFVQRHLSKIRQQEPGIDLNGLIWAARYAESEYANAGQSQKPFSMPVESSRAFKRGKVQ